MSFQAFAQVNLNILYTIHMDIFLIFFSVLAPCQRKTAYEVEPVGCIKLFSPEYCYTVMFC